MDESFYKRIEFIKKTDDMKRVFRRNVNLDGTTRENDAEHSFHIALMAPVLKDYLKDPATDIEKTVMLCLAHDLVEVYAGDTFCWDKQANKTKSARELDAADKLFSLLPDCDKKKMRALWDEFEEQKTPESLYANALDRFQPFLLNRFTEGHTWRLAKTTYSQAIERFDLIRRVLPPLWEYVEEGLTDAMKKGYIINDR